MGHILLSPSHAEEVLDLNQRSNWVHVLGVASPLSNLRELDLAHLAISAPNVLQPWQSVAFLTGHTYARAETQMRNGVNKTCTTHTHCGNVFTQSLLETSHL